MNIGQKIKKILKDRGLTVNWLAEATDIEQSYISQIITGRRKPKIPTLKKIADALNMPLSHLIEEPVKPIKPPEPKKLPRISWVMAGQWHEAIDIYDPGYAERWDSYDCKDPYAFTLEVKGDSMYPKYEDGDIIVVSPSTQWKVGDDVIAKCNDEVTFKKLKKVDGIVLLSPINSNYDDLIIRGKDLKHFRIIGVVMGLIRKTRK